MTWFRSKRRPEPLPPSFIRDKKFPINQSQSQNPVDKIEKENERKPIAPNNKL